uniref:Uncharacterized protein n=1 Tax=Oryza glumipatula TaxID=40148 RepID=A0A0E0B871_9ORYZ
MATLKKKHLNLAVSTHTLISLSSSVSSPTPLSLLLSTHPPPHSPSLPIGSGGGSSSSGFGGGARWGGQRLQRRRQGGQRLRRQLTASAHGGGGGAVEGAIDPAAVLVERAGSSACLPTGSSGDAGEGGCDGGSRRRLREMDLVEVLVGSVACLGDDDDASDGSGGGLSSLSLLHCRQLPSPPPPLETVQEIVEATMTYGARAWLLGNLVQKPLSVIPVNLADSGSERRSKKLRKEAEMSKSGRKRLCKVLNCRRLSDKACTHAAALAGGHAEATELPSNNDE